MNNLEKEILNQFILGIYDLYKKRALNNQLGFNLELGLQLINQGSYIFSNESAVLQINTLEGNSNFIVVGDIHGNIDSLFQIFEKYGFPDTTRYLFLGDYVDRGKNSCEVIVILYAFKVLFPNNIFLIRGNHEFRDMTECYGFKNECFERIACNGQSYGEAFYQSVTSSFKFLPICAILNNIIFCVHGGITALLENREQLLQLQKVGDQFCQNDSVQAEFLWNDPSDEVQAYERSSRGIGCIFGRDALSYFLQSMGFGLVIRAHQQVENGCEWPFNENKGILTVFSSLDYCDSGNDAGVACLSFDGEKLNVGTEIIKYNEMDDQVNSIPFLQAPQIHPWNLVQKMPILA